MKNVRINLRNLAARVASLTVCTAILAIAMSSCDEDNTESGKAVVSIEITKPPTKTTYKVGDKFDPAGMEVVATYDDETTAPVSVTASMLTYDFSSAGKKDVTVTYKGKTAKYGVTVTATGKELNDEEKKLVGIWSHGNYSGGFYSTWSAGGNMVYEKWYDLSAFVWVHKFDADGSYSSIWYMDYYVGALHTCNMSQFQSKWSITEKGVIHFTDRVASMDDLVNPSQSFKNKPGEGFEYLYYEPATRDGKNGLHIDILPIPEDPYPLPRFYEKIE